MICAICNKRTRVADSRPIPNGVARKRICARGHEFFTVERQTSHWLHKDNRKTRKKLPKKPQWKPKAPKPKTWLERIQAETGKLLRTFLL